MSSTYIMTRKMSIYPDYVFKLNKALYGLKQAPWAYYEKLRSFLIENGDALLPPRILDRRLQEDWARDAGEGPRVLMSLRVDFGPMG